MPRTTLNIDAPVLEDLKRLQKKENKALGTLVSELLVQALALHACPAQVSRQSRRLGDHLAQLLAATSDRNRHALQFLEGLPDPIELFL